MKRLLYLAVAAVCACALPASAAELESVEVTYEDGRYRLVSKSLYEATQAQLYRVLTDYELFIYFSSAFVESENRDADADGRPGFYTRMEACVLMFCKAYIRAGYLDLKPEYDIVATVDPEQSNFRYARERWQLVPGDDGTTMIYEFEMEPDFWVPPLVGPYVIKRSLKAGGARAVDRIERLALQITKADASD